VIEVHILIPVADNTGKAFTAKDDAPFESELLNLFGGYSKLPGLVTGQWAAGGQVYTDQSRVYAVALKSITDGDKVRQAVDFAKANYHQLEIYFRYLGLSETR
jgi:hypothetical protein